ncbi:solute carrier family 13 member 2 [Plakobranchus ocellatus]|uniref:Solute carrier family 13 member 2 n=1 Tax=Plakobranchus ocellatus TaxID=259542 RepID=A0AAV4DVZ0_9GAST|nr:solute carrier family 13 member 2 [Plakobranchus ocellatus]
MRSCDAVDGMPTSIIRSTVSLPEFQEAYLDFELIPNVTLDEDDVPSSAVTDFDTLPADEEHIKGTVNSGYQAEESNLYPGKQIQETQKSDSSAAVEQGISPSSSAPTKEPEGFSRLSKGLTLCIAYAANIGGIATLTGTPPNLVMKGIADDFYKLHQPADDQSGSPISFANWMGLAVPLSALTLVLGWFVLLIIFLCGRGCCTVNEGQSRAIKKAIRTEWKKLGPISLAEVILMVLFTFLAVLWVSRDPKESPGWSVWFEYDEKISSGATRKVSFPSDSTSAMLIALLLFIVPGKVPNICCWRKPGREDDEVYTPVLTWKQVQRKLPWGVIILLGGGFALGRGVAVSGLSHWLADKLSSLDYLDKWVLNLVLCLIVAAATEVTSNTATATLLMPIMANLAKSLGYNPLYLMVSTTLATSFAFMLPVATPPNAVVFSYGAIKVTDMAFAGFFMNIIAVSALTLAVNTWGVPIYDFDYFDEIFNKTVAASV